MACNEIDRMERKLETFSSSWRREEEKERRKVK